MHLNSFESTKLLGVDPNSTLRRGISDSPLQDVPAYGSRGVLDGVEGSIHPGDLMLLRAEFQDMKAIVSKLSDAIKGIENRLIGLFIMRM